MYECWIGLHGLLFRWCMTCGVLMREAASNSRKEGAGGKPEPEAKTFKLSKYPRQHLRSAIGKADGILDCYEVQNGIFWSPFMHTIGVFFSEYGQVAPLPPRCRVFRSRRNSNGYAVRPLQG